jgi:hypothetical protein
MSQTVMIQNNVSTGFNKLSGSRNSSCHIKIAKQKARDMKMYKQTEALQNIENENERYKFLQNLLSQGIRM